MPLKFGDDESIRLRDAKPNAKDRKKQPQPPAPSKERSPMTEQDKVAALKLGSCRFLPGSWDKRFARNLAAIANNDGTLTNTMRWNLWRLVYRYRRQINDPGLVQEAAKQLSES